MLSARAESGSTFSLAKLKKTRSRGGLNIRFGMLVVAAVLIAEYTALVKACHDTYSFGTCTWCPCSSFHVAPRLGAVGC
jgi:hypothetical protein